MRKPHHGRVSLAMTDSGFEPMRPTGLDLRIAEAVAEQVVVLVRKKLGIPPPTDEWIDAIGGRSSVGRLTCVGLGARLT